MANLTQQEFTRAIELLAEDLGLQRLRDRFVRLNALVTRRRAVSAQRLADQLYLLTGGMRRQIAATVAVHSIWTERVNEKLGEDGEKAFEEIAEKINACLGERDSVVAEKEEELDGLLGTPADNTKPGFDNEGGIAHESIAAIAKFQYPWLLEVIRREERC